MEVEVKSKSHVKVIFLVLFSGYLFCLDSTISGHLKYGEGIGDIIYLFVLLIGTVLLAFFGFFSRNKDWLFKGTIYIFTIGLILILIQAYQSNGSLFSDQAERNKKNRIHHERHLFKIDSLSLEIERNSENAQAYLELARMNSSAMIQRDKVIYYYKQAILYGDSSILTEAKLELARHYRIHNMREESKVLYREVLMQDSTNQEAIIELQRMENN